MYMIHHGLSESNSTRKVLKPNGEFKKKSRKKKKRPNGHIEVLKIEYRKQLKASKRILNEMLISLIKTRNSQVY